MHYYDSKTSWSDHNGSHVEYRLSKRVFQIENQPSDYEPRGKRYIPAPQPPRTEAKISGGQLKIRTRETESTQMPANWKSKGRVPSAANYQSPQYDMEMTMNRKKSVNSNHSRNDIYCVSKGDKHYHHWRSYIIKL